MNSISFFLSRIRSYWKLGAASFALSSLIVRFSIVITSLIAARLIDVQNFGLYSLAYFTMQAGGIVFCIGLPVTATKFISEFNKRSAGKNRPLTTHIYITYFIVSLNLALIIAWNNEYLNRWIFDGKLEQRDFLKLIVATLAHSLNSTQMGIAAGHLDYKRMSLNNYILATGFLAFVALGIKTNGLSGALTGFILTYSVASLFQIFQRTSANESASEHFLVSHFVKIFRDFSLPAYLSAAMVAPAILISQTTLIRSPGGLEQIAIFGACFQWYNAILFLPGIISSLVMPKMSGELKEKKFELFMRALRLNLTVSIFIASLLALSWPWLKKEYGEVFVQGGDSVFYFLMFTSVLNAVSNLIGQLLASSAKMWTGFFINFLWACSMISLASLFIHLKLGALGLATAFLISYGVHFFVQLIYVKKANLVF